MTGSTAKALWHPVIYWSTAIVHGALHKPWSTLILKVLFEAFQKVTSKSNKPSWVCAHLSLCLATPKQPVDEEGPKIPHIETGRWGQHRAISKRVAASLWLWLERWLLPNLKECANALCFHATWWLCHCFHNKSQSFHGSQSVCGTNRSQYIGVSQRSKSHIIGVHTCWYSPNHSSSQSISMPWACIRRKKHFGNFRTLRLMEQTWRKSRTLEKC